jgi:hypothetical protein
LNSQVSVRPGHYEEQYAVRNFERWVFTNGSNYPPILHYCHCFPPARSNTVRPIRQKFALLIPKRNFDDPRFDDLFPPLFFGARKDVG